MRRKGTASLLLAGAAALAALAAFAAPPNRQGDVGADRERGREVYMKWCAGCHGDEGRGDGPAAEHLLPKPRDFTMALYQVRSTATGQLPLDEDILRVVNEGMPGSSMPGWKAVLSGAERAAVVRYLKTLSPDFAPATAPPAALSFGSAPRGGDAAALEGRDLYRRIECWKCHGDSGRGDGTSAPTLKDDLGNPIRAADLTQNWTFNGGGTAPDIYRVLRTGMDGTPMPSFGDLIEGRIITDEQLWRVAQYVRSLSPAEPPRARDVVRAARVEAGLPSGPDDSAWASVERYYYPLVGQVIVRPRWFAPMVSGLWVQALHDGRALALRVTWHDPSQSPDSSWNVWRARVAARMGADDSAAADSTPLPDRLAVQFPARLPAGLDRPYFLMGSVEEPVYLWSWESEPRSAVEATARGADRLEPLAGLTDSVATSSTYDHGEWRVQFTRALSTGDSTNQLEFVTGRPIPMAFYAWDGSNGETGARMAVGSWSAVYLAEPARASTYLSPAFAMLATAGLGLTVIWRAQRHRRKTTDDGTDIGTSEAE
ncbi:MAG: c-type cytochrome [Gemmatimonadetes bacterium]|nr:c-type cytochrome [Gemmatimonadota bacterium]